MKKHTTNYYNSLIEVAEDCPVNISIIPKPNGKVPGVAQLQFDLISENPYKFTSDEVLFEVHCKRKEITSEEKEAEQENFFSKGQPCFRASALTKRFGWGVHYNEEGKISLVKLYSEEYENFLKDEQIKKYPAMRNKRKPAN